MVSTEEDLSLGLDCLLASKIDACADQIPEISHVMSLCTMYRHVLLTSY